MCGDDHNWQEHINLLPSRHQYIDGLLPSFLPLKFSIVIFKYICTTATLSTCGMHSSLRGLPQSSKKSESEEHTPTYLADVTSLYIPPLKVRAAPFEQKKLPVDFNKSPEEVLLPTADSQEIKYVC